MTPTTNLPEVGEHDDVSPSGTPRPRSRPRRRGWSMPPAGVVAAAVVMTLAVGCSGDDDDAADRAGSTSSEVTEPAGSSSSSTDEPASTTAPAPGAATGVESGEADLPEFPAEAPLEHGGETWAVYLAVATDPEDPAIDAAQASAVDAGYRAGEGHGSIACDEGAPEALGVSPDSIAVAVYFGSQADADEAEAAFLARDQDVAGVVQVVNYCLD